MMLCIDETDVCQVTYLTELCHDNTSPAQLVKNFQKTKSFKNIDLRTVSYYKSFKKKGKGGDLKKKTHLYNL